MARAHDPASRRSLCVLVATLSLALVFGLGNACGGKHGDLSGGGGGLKGVGVGGGDAGSDAGDGGADAGDAGTDAGPCVPFVNPIGSIYDGCVTISSPPAFMTGGADAGCAATLTSSNVTCSGTLAGSANAFTAACTDTLQNYFCASPSTPGVLSCKLADGGGACNIRICDTATIGNCGP
ncbi:MAG TPA: hypothetical protein VN874_05615 [Myxococcales bacterium]|nr:hypothetical protein [Myxococcales bacterium]